MSNGKKRWAVAVAWNSLIWIIIFFPICLTDSSLSGFSDYLSLFFLAVFMALVSGSLIYMYLLAPKRNIEVHGCPSIS